MINLPRRHPEAWMRPGASATNVGIWASPRENDSPVSEQAAIVQRVTMTGRGSIASEISERDPIISSRARRAQAQEKAQ